MRALPLLAAALLAACAGAGRSAGSPRTETLELHDAERDRRIPVTLYTRGTTKGTRLALLSHGHGGKATDYTFLAHALVAHGYTVASVQHELPGDAPLPTMGTPQEVRRPSWERGALTLHFVRGELARRHPGLDTGRLLLVGHSHGGDTAALYAAWRPGEVERLVTLDNRRMPLPRASPPRVLTLRSSDQPADEGVLPDEAERAALDVRVVPLATTRHDDMWDGATPAQRQEMLQHLADFLAR